MKNVLFIFKVDFGLFSPLFCYYEMFTGNHKKMTRSLPFEDATFRDFDINDSLKCKFELDYKES